MGALTLLAVLLGPLWGGPAPAVAPAPAPAPAVAPAAAPLPGEREFVSCLRLPVGKPIRVTLKPETEITDVIAWIASVTCKGFIVPASVPLAGRKVTVYSPEKLSAAEAYRLFLSLLESVQLTIEPTGRFLRIIEAAKAPRAELPMFPAGAEPDASSTLGHVTRLVRLRHVDAGELATVLQAYRGEQGSVVAHPPTRTLILTDRGPAIERLLALIAELDVAGDELRLWVLPVKHIPTAELAETLGQLMDASAAVGGASGARPALAAAIRPPAGATPAASPGERAGAATASGIGRILPDERAGRLLVTATEAAFARLVTLAQRLDVPAELRSSQVHVYRCRHADCEAVGSILATLAGVEVSRGPSPDTGRPGRPPPAAIPTPPTATGREGPGGSRGARPVLFDGELRVTSDPTTNSLLVLASLNDFRTLRRLAEEVDVPRKQVFIEATIMEILEKKDRSVSVGYHGGKPLAGGEAAALGGFDAGKSLLLDKQGLGSALVGLSGLAVGAPLDGVARVLGIPEQNVPSLGAFVQLLQRNDDVDLVANPHILITNNHEGQISVGQKVPFQAGFVATAGAQSVTAGLLPTVSVSREDVALTLKLTPHVNEDNLIRLTIDQEMSEIASASFSPLGPATTKRTALTTVFVRDQQTTIIGGLMRDKVTEGAQKIPILGDIPVIGALFRSTQKTVEKQNIIIAITPYVINQPSDLVKVLEAKLRDRRDFVRHFGTHHERRLLRGPLGPLRSPGMLERINRAVREQEADAEVAPGPR